MSWNWLARIAFHAASISAAGHCRPLSAPATAPHISASRRASSLLRLPFFVFACDV